MQKRYLRPLQDAIALLRVPRAEVALRPEAAWRPLQRILDAVHAQLRCSVPGVEDVRRCFWLLNCNACLKLVEPGRVFRMSGFVFACPPMQQAEPSIILYVLLVYVAMQMQTSF